MLQVGVILHITDDTDVRTLKLTVAEDWLKQS